MVDAHDNVEVLSGSSEPTGEAPVFEPVREPANTSADPWTASLPDADLLAQAKVVEDLSDQEHQHFSHDPDLSDDHPDQIAWKQRTGAIEEEFRAGIERLAGMPATTFTGLAAKASATLKLRAMFEHIDWWQEASLVRGLVEDAVRLGQSVGLPQAVHADDPDAALFQLFADLKVALAIQEASGDAYCEADERRREPEPPEIMFRQPEDDEFFPPSIYRVHDVFERHWVGEFQIERFRSGTVPTWQGPAHDKPARFDESGPRRAEIVAGWDAWQAGLKTRRLALGLDTLEATDKANIAAYEAIQRQILHTPATTVRGVFLKATMFGKPWSHEWELDRELRRSDEPDGKHAAASTMLDISRIVAAGGFPEVANLGRIGPLLPSPDLDKPLVEAWAEHQRLSPLLTTALDREADLEKQFKQDYPRRPEALKPRDNDFLKHSIRFVTEAVDEASYYQRSAVEFLRRRPVTKSAFVRWFDPERPGRDAVEKRVPDAEAQVRADEIVAAWDQWQAECDAFRVEIGLTAAAEEAEKLGDQMHAVGNRLRDLPALSLRGLQLKASWALTLTGTGEEDMRRVLEQVDAFARRHDYVHRRPEDLKAGEDSIDLPAADWELFRRFCEWSQDAIELETLEKDEGYEGDLAERYKQNTMLRRAVVDVPATSLQGIRLKGHLYAWCGRDDPDGIEEEWAELLARSQGSDAVIAHSIGRDLTRMDCATSLKSVADRMPAAQTGDRRALEAYRTWLSNEFRSLTAEMYPDRTSAMMNIGAVNNAGDTFHFRSEAPASSRAERVLAIFGLDWTKDAATDLDVASKQQAAA